MAKKQHIEKINSGFTLIELLIVMGIFVVITGGAVPIYSGLQIKSRLNENIAETAQALRLAREYSRAGFYNSAYGVFFEVNPDAQDRIIIYKGDSYALRSIDYDRITVLDNTVSLASTLTGNEINFAQNSGAPNTYGEVIFSMENNQDRIVIINEQGFVGVE